MTYIINIILIMRSNISCLQLVHTAVISIGLSAVILLLVFYLATYSFTRPMKKRRRRRSFLLSVLFGYVLAALAFSGLMFNVGSIMGMPIVVIGALYNNHNSPLGLDATDASWFASIVFITQPVGSLVSGFFNNFLGRKYTVLGVTVLKFTGWFVIYNASSVTMLLAAVTLMGLSVGFMEAPVMAYLGEVTQPRFRGTLTGFAPTFFNLGILSICFLGAITDWRTTMILATFGPVITFTGLTMVPDSPPWLISKGRIKDAEKAMCWLRGWVEPSAIQEEFTALVTYVQQTHTVKDISPEAEYTPVPDKDDGAVNVDSNTHVQAPSKMKLLLDRSMHKPLRLLVAMFFISSCSSLTALRPFFIQILRSLDLPVSPHWVVVFCVTFHVFGALTMVITVSRLGKRRLEFISLGTCVFCCFGIGTYTALHLHLPWVPLVLFSLVFFAGTFGVMSVPWLLIGEIFPLHGRVLGAGLSAGSCYAMNGLVTKTFLSLERSVGVSGCCFVYGTVGLLGFVYLYLNMPETEGHTLQDIQNRVSKKKKEAVAV